ncbi:MAG TPA: nitrile hydratase accessory protein [Burkholderiales bacterium]|nr:nitrile hydratase accessory protein [Burkholderiales bacterium]
MARVAHPKQVPIGALDAIPANERSPTFNEPWEAQAFAITLALHRRGLFTWDEWAATLATEIKAAQARGDPDTGSTYYHHWLCAIERIVRDKGLADEGTLMRYREAWHKAAERTRHGEPIVLTPEDLA